jgi:general secretion pathway protein A
METGIPCQVTTWHGAQDILQSLGSRRTSGRPPIRSPTVGIKNREGHPGRPEGLGAFRPQKKPLFICRFLDSGECRRFPFARPAFLRMFWCALPSHLGYLLLFSNFRKGAGQYTFRIFPSNTPCLTAPSSLTHEFPPFPEIIFSHCGRLFHGRATPKTGNIVTRQAARIPEAQIEVQQKSKAVRKILPQALKILKSKFPTKEQSSYRETYGFSEEPFALNPDPKFLYPAPTHLDALSTMLSGIKNRRGIIFITGEAGVGKTLLLYALLRDLDEKNKAAFIFNPRNDFKGILEDILRNLGVSVQEKEEALFSLLVHFRKYFNERFAQGETVSIVIDEAQSLDEEVLEGLFRLATPDSPALNSLQILLLGHPDLEKKLNSERLSSLKERTIKGGRIRPLNQEESGEYMNHRLKLAGRGISEIFTPEAINKVWEFSKGNPRVMNLLCDRALWVGHSNSSSRVDSEIINKAMKDLDYLRVGQAKASQRILRKQSRSLILKILFFLLSVGLFSYSTAWIISLLLQK